MMRLIRSFEAVEAHEQAFFQIGAQFVFVHLGDECLKLAVHFLKAVVERVLAGEVARDGLNDGEHVAIEFDWAAGRRRDGARHDQAPKLEMADA